MSKTSPASRGSDGPDNNAQENRHSTARPLVNGDAEERMDAISYSEHIEEARNQSYSFEVMENFGYSSNQLNNDSSSERADPSLINVESRPFQDVTLPAYTSHRGGGLIESTARLGFLYSMLTADQLSAVPEQRSQTGMASDLFFAGYRLGRQGSDELASYFVSELRLGEHGFEETTQNQQENYEEAQRASPGFLQDISSQPRNTGNTRRRDEKALRKHETSLVNWQDQQQQSQGPSEESQSQSRAPSQQARLAIAQTRNRTNRQWHRDQSIDLEAHPPILAQLHELKSLTSGPKGKKIRENYLRTILDEFDKELSEEERIRELGNRRQLSKKERKELTKIANRLTSKKTRFEKIFRERSHALFLYCDDMSRMNAAEVRERIRIMTDSEPQRKIKRGSEAAQLLEILHKQYFNIELLYAHCMSGEKLPVIE